MATCTTPRSFLTISWPAWWLWQRPPLPVLRVDLNSNVLLFLSLEKSLNPSTPEFQKVESLPYFYPFDFFFCLIGSHKDIEWSLAQVSLESCNTVRHVLCKARKTTKLALSFVHFTYHWTPEWVGGLFVLLLRGQGLPTNLETLFCHLPPRTGDPSASHFTGPQAFVRDSGLEGAD